MSFRASPGNNRQMMGSSPSFLPRRRASLAAGGAISRSAWDASLRGFARVAERSADAIMITDTSGLIEYVNPAFKAMTGFAHAEALGKTPAILRSGLHESGFYEALWGTLRDGRGFRAVFFNRRRNGEIYCEEKAIRPYVGPSGAITHFIASGRALAAASRREGRDAG